jgi:hypothetical protein
MDLEAKHVVGALSTFALGAGVWNVQRSIFPEASVEVGVFLLIVGVLLAEAMS